MQAMEWFTVITFAIGLFSTVGWIYYHSMHANKLALKNNCQAKLENLC